MKLKNKKNIKKGQEKILEIKIIRIRFEITIKQRTTPNFLRRRKKRKKAMLTINHLITADMC